MEGRVAALCYNGLEAEYERDEADLRGSMSEYEGIASIVRRTCDGCWDWISRTNRSPRRPASHRTRSRR